VSSARDDLPLTALLTALTGACPGWTVWKNADRAAGGAGDVDSVAPQTEWPAATGVFHAWAAETGVGPVFGCRHFPGALHLVACDQVTGRLVEVDFGSRLVLRGMAYVSAEELAPLTLLSATGFRQLRPGAEGLFLTLATLMSSGGRRSTSAERVRELLASDEAGVELAASVFGRSAAAAQRCAAAVRAGGWDRLAAARWEAGALAAVIRAAHLSAARVRFGLRRGPGCPLLATLAAGRRLPSPADDWLERVARTHEPL
jgi:hypothetical protein